VDDLEIAAPTDEELDKIEKTITKHVELERRGMKGLLGMELTWDEDKLWLTQTRLIERTVEQVGEIGKWLSLSSDSSDYEKLSEQDEPADRTGYQQLIGSLLFIARGTRPDISAAVNLLGRRAKEPSIRNWEMGLRVLADLYSTKYVGICLSKPIEAAEGAKDACWLRLLLHEMKIRPTNQAVPLYTDNMTAQQLSQDGSYRRRTRHLDNRYHYIRDQVCKKHLIVIGIPGKENPADAMTRLISMQCLKSWMGSIGITDKTGGLM
jgi:hypothetical protein